MGQSPFSQPHNRRNVILLDHDLPENPYWVRVFHDELVELSKGLYLVSSHLNIAKQLRYIGYFALDFTQL